MSAQQKWFREGKRLLDPIGDLWGEMHVGIEKIVGEMDESDLALAERTFGALSQTNCGWTTYQARAITLQIIKYERHRRQREATA